MKKQNEFLLIVDGSSLLATSYYSSLPKAIRKEKDEAKKEQLYPRLLKKDKSGRYCNALELFFHTLFTIMTFQQPSHLVVCWDAGRNTFRKELWPSYKSNRQETPGPLREQFESCYELCEALSICQVRDTRYEADDFAGSIAFQVRDYLPVRILTRDKDYFQLIDDQIHIWYGMADLKKVKAWRKTHQMPNCLPSRVVQIDETVLHKEFGYHAAAVPMIKCLYGDPSDNIPGVSGMGENRSIKLAEHYHTIDELYAPIEAARTKADRKRLARLWKSWGINISPFAVLSRKGTKDRLNAREMAEICYTLGKIRTDLDLSDCFEEDFTPELFRCQFEKGKIYSTLRRHNIDLKIGRSSTIPGEDPAERKKMRAKKAAKNKAKNRPASGQPEPAAAQSKADSTGAPKQPAQAASKRGKKPAGQYQGVNPAKKKPQASAQRQASAKANARKRPEPGIPGASQRKFMDSSRPGKKGPNPKGPNPRRQNPAKPGEALACQPRRPAQPAGKPSRAQSQNRSRKDRNQSGHRKNPSRSTGSQASSSARVIPPEWSAPSSLRL